MIQSAAAADLCINDTARAKSFDADEGRLYRVRLIPASASTDKSKKASSLPGPATNPQRQAEWFQTWSAGSWNSTCISTGHQIAGKNLSSADWPSNLISPSTADTFFSCRPLLPLSVNEEKLEQSDTDSAAGYSKLQADRSADFASQMSKCDQSSAAVRFACPQCSLSYKRAADLNRHLKQKHRTSSLACSSASLSSACVTTTSHSRDTPLNLALKDACKFSQPARRQHGAGRLHCEDTLQDLDLPLDLSVASRSLKSNGQTTAERQLDSFTGCRSAASYLLPPPFVFNDFLTSSSIMNSSETSSSSFYSSAPSFSLSSVPSFYASFAKFMENTYKPLWKSYFDGTVMGQNASTLRPENVFGRRSTVDSQPLYSKQQATKDCFAVNSKATELSRSVTTSNNNNNSVKCGGLTGQSKVSADAARPIAKDRQSAGDGFGSWGKCPLCPFVCPHPLVMRRHLDVHDESEPHRSAQSRGRSAAAPNTSVELDAVGRPGSVFDVSGGGLRTSTSTFNCSLPRTTTDGTDTSGNISTPSWLLPSSGLTTNEAAGGCVSWNSGRGVMSSQSAGARTVAPTRTPSSKADDAKDWPLQCGGLPCNERSKSAKDVKNSFPELHPAAGGSMLTASAAAEYLTPPWLRSLTPWHPPLSTSTPAVDWWSGWTSGEHGPRSTFSAGVNSRTTTAAGLTPLQSTPITFSPLPSRAHSADFKVTNAPPCSQINVMMLDCRKHR